MVSPWCITLTVTTAVSKRHIYSQSDVENLKIKPIITIIELCLAGGSG